MGLWAKTERFWIRGMRQKDVWHLKFRNSEICVWCHVSGFQFQRLGKLKKTKGLGRILPSGRGLPHHQSLLSELQNPPWFRSIDLRFGCCGFWFGSRLLGEFFARICRAWFLNCARIREFVEFGSSWERYSTLVRVASSLNFIGSWIFMEAWCVAIGFWESKRRHTKGILFASQEIKSVGVSWVCGPRQKDFGLEGCGKRMSDTWSSEIQKFAYGVTFQSFSLRSLVSWRN